MRMILFESESIYYLDGRVLGIRKGEVTYRKEGKPLITPEDAHQPLPVSGIESNDLGMLMCIGTKEGVAKVPYLVAVGELDECLIVPSDMVVEDHECYIDEYMAQRLQNLNRGGLATFGLESIMAEINRRYPRA